MAANNDLLMDNLYNLGSINPTERRRYDLKDIVTVVQPEFNAFVNLLRRLTREVTTDPIFKFLEYRPTWRNKRVIVKSPDGGTTPAVSVDSAPPKTPIAGATYYKVYADSSATSVTPYDMIHPGHTVRIHWANSTLFGVIVDKDNSTNEVYWVAELSKTGSDAVSSIADGTTMAIVGTAFAQGSYRPDFGVDQMELAQGQTQIFKTAFGIDNTTLNTSLFGGNEYRRLQTQAMLNHQREISEAFYWGSQANVTYDGRPLQTFKGLYDEINEAGNVQVLDTTSPTTSVFDQLVDITKNVFDVDPGGSRIVMAGGSAFHALQKLSSGLYGSMPSSFQVNIQPKEKWGFRFTQVQTAYGVLNITWDRALQNLGANYMFVLDFDYLKYRPLQNRDTQLETGIEVPGYDGVVNQYITECGLQVQSKERHWLIEVQ